MGEVADTAEITAALDVGVCSSYSESFPNAIGEAMACAVPCVSTDVGDCAAIIGSTGRVVPARNPAALAEAMEAMLRLTPRARAELGAAARARIDAEYSLAAVARRYEQIYEDVSCVA
jgi:glycosyltransferase involved in cell wall biosynthesis